MRKTVIEFKHTPLLEPGIDRRWLDLRSSRSTPSGVLLLSYLVARSGAGEAA